MSLISVDASKDYSKEFTIFTDGSALSNSKNAPAGWGVYIPLMKKSLSKGIIGTNNRAELEAIRVALWYVCVNFEAKFDEIFKTLNKRDMYVISDSEYSLKVVTGINTAKANVDIINMIKKDMDYIKNNLKLKLYFIHVNSHTGGTDFFSINNAIVDELARLKAEEMKLNTSDANHFSINE